MTNDTETPRVHITMLVWLKPAGRAALAAFREGAAPLFSKYDVRIERMLAGTGKGQLVGMNAHDVPDVLQVFSVPSLEAFRAYTTDPEYVRLATMRDAGIRRMTAVIGRALAADPSSTSSSVPSGRLYGMGFLRFAPDGAARLAAFNHQAQSLFSRHGMHIERAIEVDKTQTPVGEPLADFAPERVVVFFLDNAEALRGYASDPEYVELAPIRDRGLRAYDFFLGKVPA